MMGDGSLTAISLCSGIGGLDIAFEQAGIRVTHMVERDPFCCAVLRKNFPRSVVVEDDIASVEDLPYADVIFGGIPCQPYSVAGSRRGFADERHLWPSAFRIIQQVQPRAVVVENVRGAVAGTNNLADCVLSDLESIGYAGAAFVFPACLFGTPHERYRVFLVAYTDSQRPHEPTAGQTASNPKWHNPACQRDRAAVIHAPLAGGQNVAYACRAGRQKRHTAAQSGGKRHLTRRTAARSAQRLSEPGMGRITYGPAAGLDSLSRPLRSLAAFPGFPAGQGAFQFDYEPARTIGAADRDPHWKERIEALGNAVVWQQAYPIARAVYEWLAAPTGTT